MIWAGLFCNTEGWAVSVVLVAALCILVPFAFAGYEFARIAVPYLSGFATAHANMEIVARVIGNRKLTGVLFLLAGIVGLVVLFILPGEWSYFDLQRHPAGESGRVPLYLFGWGLLYGFLAFSGSFLRRPPAPLPPLTREERRARARGMLVVVGAVLGVFGSFFVLYVLGKYAITPVLRYLL